MNLRNSREKHGHNRLFDAAVFHPDAMTDHWTF